MPVNRAQALVPKKFESTSEFVVIKMSTEGLEELADSRLSWYMEGKSLKAVEIGRWRCVLLVVGLRILYSDRLIFFLQ